MDAKLTLKLNKAVIERARQYAREHDQSLSKLIENYLQALTIQSDNDDPDISPLVSSLTGVIKLTDHADTEKYTEYLSHKYQ